MKNLVKNDSLEREEKFRSDLFCNLPSILPITLYCQRRTIADHVRVAGGLRGRRRKRTQDGNRQSNRKNWQLPQVRAEAQLCLRLHLLRAQPLPAWLW